MLGALGLATPANAGTTTFTNPNLITILDAGALRHLPLSVDRRGQWHDGLVTDVRLTLTNLSHSYFGDLDVMLAAPGGRTWWSSRTSRMAARVQDPHVHLRRWCTPLTYNVGPARTDPRSMVPAIASPARARASGATTFAAAFGGTVPNGTGSCS